MAVAAGETIIAGKVPGERIATETVTANSGTITTTETEVASVTAAVVNGRTYRVRWIADVASSVVDDLVRVRIREDNDTGTQLNLVNVKITQNARDLGFALEAEYTADATEDKTFSATAIRQEGTGNVVFNASGSEPTYLYVDFIR